MRFFCLLGRRAPSLVALDSSVDRGLWFARFREAVVLVFCLCGGIRVLLLCWHPRSVFGVHALPLCGATPEGVSHNADASAKANAQGQRVKPEGITRMPAQTQKPDASAKPPPGGRQQKRQRSTQAHRPDKKTKKIPPPVPRRRDSEQSSKLASINRRMLDASFTSFALTDGCPSGTAMLQPGSEPSSP
jgi:hypothetical protein